MCVCVCVCVFVCFGGLTRERKGVRKRNRTFSFLLFCVLLCRLEEEHNKKRRTQTICLPFPPSVSSSAPLVHSLTYRTLLNGQKWPRGWREPHRQTDHSVEMFVQQRRRKSAKKRVGVRTTWVLPSPCLPSLPFPLFGRGSPFSPNKTKMSSVHFGEKKSVSQQQLHCLALTTVCVFVCVYHT